MSQAQFNCPSCEQTFEAPFEPGYGVACPKCQSAFVPSGDAAAASDSQNESLLRSARIVQTLGFFAVFIGIAIAFYGIFQIGTNQSAYYVAGIGVAGSSMFLFILAQLIFIRAALFNRSSSE